MLNIHAPSVLGRASCRPARAINYQLTFNNESPTFSRRVIQHTTTPKRNVSFEKFFVKFCNITSNMENNIKTFIFLDTETTGLPAYECNRTKLTELCLIAVRSDHIELGVIPRVQPTLNLCFNPGKCVNPQATNVTGLSNELLEFQPPFNNNTFEIIQNFLSLQQKPICLVAHNGNRFDYPILQAEIQRTNSQLSEDILCVDSLNLFRELHKQDVENKVEDESVIGETHTTARNTDCPPEFQDGYDRLLLEVLNDLIENSKPDTQKLSMEEIQKINETTPKTKTVLKTERSNFSVGASCSSKDERRTTGSIKKKLFTGSNFSFKLGELYKRLTEKEPLNAHAAYVDTKMLVECATIMGERFTRIANKNAKNFCDIPPMTPGKKIGT